LWCIRFHQEENMNRAIIVLGLGMTTMLTVSAGQASEAVELYAAGSLRAALSDVSQAFTASHGVTVRETYGPSGLLRERIENGEVAQVFASANMEHPQTLAEANVGGPVVLFARNRLCALAQPGLTLSTENFLDVLLDEKIRLGTSTPKADPSGDYAWELFNRAEEVRAGSYQVLDHKALQLTGGTNSPVAPEGRNPYAWVMTEDRADVFLTYCTNAVLAQRDSKMLQIVQVPEDMAVGADYGLSLLDRNSPAAIGLAMYILSPKGQQILSDYGFNAPLHMGD
jgi:molybdenum ABC transporter molybdate-binding protein